MSGYNTTKGIYAKTISWETNQKHLNKNSKSKTKRIMEKHPKNKKENNEKNQKTPGRW